MQMMRVIVTAHVRVMSVSMCLFYSRRGGLFEFVSDLVDGALDLIEKKGHSCAAKVGDLVRRKKSGLLQRR